MNNIKRYDVSSCDEYPLCQPLIEDEEGDYCLFEHYERLTRANAVLQRTVELMAEHQCRVCREHGMDCSLCDEQPNFSKALANKSVEKFYRAQAEAEVKQ